MPKIAINEVESKNPPLTTGITAATGGKITLPVIAAMLATPNAAAPAGTLTNGVSNGNTTDRGLAYVIASVLQMSTSLYRI